MHNILNRSLFATLAIISLSLSAQQSLPTNVADEDDLDGPTGQQPPPAYSGPLRQNLTPAGSGTINGIFYNDALVSAGVDESGFDRGNEPGITLNPLDPFHIAITSFMGSNWSTGGNAAILVSTNLGTNWTYAITLPPPPGVATTGCPCDLNADWGRNGTLYTTILNSNSHVYTAQAADPAGAWTYRLNTGVAEKTNGTATAFNDQPWLWSGPYPGNNSVVQVGVGYDNFNAAYSGSEMRCAESPGFNPMSFTRDLPVNGDGQVTSSSMNPGTRIAVGPDGSLFMIFQRLVATQAGGVKQLTYLVSQSGDGGLSWTVANSDHASGAKIVAANVYSFQGNGSKVGNVNALLGGVDAIAADQSDGSVWVVYGNRGAVAGTDRLYLVHITRAGSTLTVGPARQISPAGAVNAYLPAVATLRSGEVGVLFLTWDGANFTYQFVQTTDGGLTLAKSTVLTSFTSPFADNGNTRQRIFGDYLQLRGNGCNFYGVYPAKGNGVNSVTSIDPYFMRAPAAGTCNLNGFYGLTPSAGCVGSPGITLVANGAGFLNGTTLRFNGNQRISTFISAAQVNAALPAADFVSAGSASITLLDPSPGGGLTGTVPFPIDSVPAGSTGNTLLLNKTSGLTVRWNATANTRNYNVWRCGMFFCTYSNIAQPTGNSYVDSAGAASGSYRYYIESVNGCGATP